MYITAGKTPYGRLPCGYIFRCTEDVSSFAGKVAHSDITPRCVEGQRADIISLLHTIDRQLAIRGDGKRSLTRRGQKQQCGEQNRQKQQRGAAFCVPIPMPGIKLCNNRRNSFHQRSPHIQSY